MAFNVNARYGDNVATAKDGEAVSVQHVTVTSGDRVSERIEARIFVDTDRYTGPTKTAIVFDNVEALDDFIDALSTAADDCRALLEANGSQAEAAVEAVPVKPTVKKRRSVASKARSTAAKGKAANAKAAATKAS